MSAGKLRHVLFDLDGTLIDSAPAILASFRAAFEQAGITPAVPIEESIIGPPMAETLQMLTGGAPPAVIERLGELFMAGYDGGGYRHTTAFEGVAEMLAALGAAGRRLYIATNKRIRPTRLILEHLGWSGHFEAVYSIDLFKPRLADKAAMIARLMADHALPADDAVYVGDREEDGRAADANALGFVAASWGYGSLRPAELAPGWRVAHTPGELGALLG